MKEQFCTYEISIKLKELGFDEECLTSFEPGWNFNMPSGRTKNNSNFPNENITNQKCAAPLWQQCIDWFREKHDIYIYINPGFDNLGKPEIYQWEMKIRNRVFIKDGDFKSYEEAREQAILKAIELCQKE